ncbi:hypothetical protein [Blastococcus mobilis]|uniref:Uncharacterized protein n=1 Tax=Blastococcus mobilis TaxID=1938746 RepID=A0A239A8X6_9ACTN|nr:hypothetical protein [Blastococcus mobilis]SNR91882.1 hypothetical protein SAMN06272737_13922 [Blastococcus mobilis]
MAGSAGRGVVRGAVRLAAAAGVALSPAGAVLRYCRISRLSRVGRRERPVVRYQHPAPGGLLRADVMKLGNIPAAGGWRFLGRVQGRTNRHLGVAAPATDTGSR